MRWRTRDRLSSVIIKKSKKELDDDVKDIPKSAPTHDLGKSQLPPPPTGAGFLGALDKVKEPRFLSAKKEKRNNIKLNL